MPRLLAGSWIWWGERRGLGSGAPPLRFSWAVGRGDGPAGPLVSPGLQLMFAEHMPCGGPGRAPLLPTAPSEGGAVIVAIFQMGKRALKS